MKPIRGRVWKYGDAVNTDVIFPGKYTYTISEPKEMAAHAMEDLDPDFAAKVKPGDIVVGGANFGCGSSREQAVVCLKEAGVGAIVAKSFARIFYRNCINMALPAIVCPEAVDAVKCGDELRIDLDSGRIVLGTREFSFPLLPPQVLEIIAAGGLQAYTRNKLQHPAAVQG